MVGVYRAGIQGVKEIGRLKSIWKTVHKIMKGPAPVRPARLQLGQFEANRTNNLLFRIITIIAIMIAAAAIPPTFHP